MFQRKGDKESASFVDASRGDGGDLREGDTYFCALI